MDLSIIIPALNERDKIIEDVRSAADFLTTEGLRGEVIVVVDGSTDDTFDVVSNYAQRCELIYVLPYCAKRGKGAAIKRGVEAAHGTTIMFADAGMCVPYRDAQHGLAMLGAGTCDLAIGSRALPGTVLVKTQPKWRRMGSIVFRVLIQSVMGIPREIGDTQCGFKIYRGEVARNLFGALFTAGYMFDIEIILRALKNGYRIGAFPVHWRNDEDSRYKAISGSLQVLWSLLEIRCRLLFEAPHARQDLIESVTLTGATRRD